METLILIKDAILSFIGYILSWAFCLFLFIGLIGFVIHGFYIAHTGRTWDDD